MVSIGDHRNPCHPLLQVGTRSPDPSKNWDRMHPLPHSTSTSSSSGLFSSQLGKAKPPTPVWDTEKESKAQGTFSEAWGFLYTSPCWSLRKPRSAQADGGKNVFSPLKTEAGLGWVDRKVLGQGRESPSSLRP